MADAQESLSVIALISGGKDSMFSLLHCLANGHTIVALANLYPAPETKGNEATTEIGHLNDHFGTHGETWDMDSDSFMYQTAGHHLIPLYAEALGLPLYRHSISGTNRDASKSYQGVPVAGQDHDDDLEDETEALIPLLKNIVAAHPTANAISSGAILSTYQRTRIESVAIRLGLIPLAYLWQYPLLPPSRPDGLLDDMADVGLDARIVKVASGGLGKELLWSNLMDCSTRRRITKATARFGGSMLGEGGEYETMVVAGPSDVWNGKIRLAETDRRLLTDTSDLTAWLIFKAGSGQVLPNDNEEQDVQYSRSQVSANLDAVQGLCDSQDIASVNPTTGGNSDQWHGSSANEQSQKHCSRNLRSIGLWDKHFEHMLCANANRSICRDLGTPAIAPVNGKKSVQIPEEHFQGDSSDNDPIVVRSDDTMAILNVQASGIVRTGNSDAGEQMTAISQQIRTILAKAITPSMTVVFATLVLQSMADYGVVNDIYGAIFSQRNPPARVTIAGPLPPNIKVMMSIICANVACETKRRIDGLHVQSRSYWAPANIGPYSQAISVVENDEPSLIYVAGQIPLIPATMRLCNANSFHERSALALQHLWRIGEETRTCYWAGAVAFITGQEVSKAITCWRQWEAIHDPLLWQRVAEKEEDPDPWDRAYGSSSTLVNEQVIHRLPNFSQISKDKDAHSVPSFFAVQVDGLPRNSDIEWQGLGFGPSKVVIESQTIVGMHITTCTSNRRSMSYIGIPAQGLADSPLAMAKSAIQGVENASDPTTSRIVTMYTHDRPLLFAAARHLNAQAVPCQSVWGPRGELLTAALVVQLENCQAG